MKRISVLTVLILMILASATKGYNYRYYGTWRYRVRWSMHTHSLVPGHVRYSPYAYKYGHPGLVPYWVRYSPYAHSYKHPSGLVNDYASSMSSIYYFPDEFSYKGPGWVACNDSRGARDCGNHGSNPDQARESYEQKLEARKDRVKRLRQSRQQRSTSKAKDGKEIIFRYLEGKNIDFRTNRILQIEGKTISVDFLLKDRNTIIKYWNPVEILSLEKQAEYRRNFYEKYLDSWKDFCGEYVKTGGKIYQIVSADVEEISAKLMLCPELNDAEKTYALAQNGASTVRK